MAFTNLSSLDIEDHDGSAAGLKLAGTLVTSTAAELNKLDGVGSAVASGTQAANIPDMAIVYTSNDPSITPDGSVTFADGSTPTVAELLEAVEELTAKVNLLIAATEAFGITASS